MRTEHFRITRNRCESLRDALCGLRGIVFSALLVVSCLNVTVRAQEQMRPAALDALTIERLAAVGRLWGAVKFFHPYLAYQDIDWDDALVKTIPQIKTARTPDEYRQAVNRMLQVLDDPTTVVVSVSESNVASAPTTAAKDPVYFRVLEDYVLVNAAAWATAMATQEKERSATAYPQMMAAIGKAKGVIWDCRYKGVATPEEYLKQFLQEFLSLFVQGNILLGTERYRVHNGYASQLDDFGYSSAFVTRASRILAGKAESKKPLAVITDERTPNLIFLLSGLQAAGAKIIQIGKHDEIPRTSTHEMLLADGVRVRFRTTEFIHPNGSLLFQPDVHLPDQAVSESAVMAAVSAAWASPGRAKTTASPPPIIRNVLDNPYSQMAFPSDEYRLLALFRFWNVIHYFFPYKHLTDKPWETVLTEFIPRFLENKTQLDYEMTVAEMVARLQDTHGFVRLKALDAHLGEFAPPLSLRVATGKLTVAHLLDETAMQVAGVKSGDVIVAIDGEPTEKRIAYLAGFYALSTPQAAYRDVYPVALRGAKDTKARLLIEAVDGQRRVVELLRTASWRTVAAVPPRKTPIYQVLANGYGYIDLARLPRADAQKAMDAVLNTPGLIFDMRGYPKSTAWEIGPRLSVKKNFPVTQIRVPFRAATDFDSVDLSSGKYAYSFEQEMPVVTGATYKGKVVMLINEQAFSQSEHTCLFFEAATDVTFIGSPTVGANGGITNLVLPGGNYVYFTGGDVRHIDGRQLQRVGIQPHIKVEPTPQGIREERDEVLEAGIRYLDSTLKKSTSAR
ncbi:MAG: hypothetical protein JST84_28990 [Acidobacteria bacterium]|nr:hypothetical protein [Acidobacteriota bacterium]